MLYSESLLAGTNPDSVIAKLSSDIVASVFVEPEAETTFSSIIVEPMSSAPADNAI